MYKHSVNARARIASAREAIAEARRMLPKAVEDLRICEKHLAETDAVDMGPFGPVRNEDGTLRTREERKEAHAMVAAARRSVFLLEARIEVKQECLERSMRELAEALAEEASYYEATEEDARAAIAESEAILASLGEASPSQEIRERDALYASMGEVSPEWA